MIGTSLHGIGVYSETGIYQCQTTKALYWKINQIEAISLNEAHGLPQFTLIDLSETTIDNTVWGGYVYPRIRGAEFGNIVGRSGILIRKGLRLYIRTNTPRGYGHNVMVENVEFEDVCRFSMYYFNWDLVVIRDGQEIVAFSSPNPLPKLRIVDDEQQIAEEHLHPAHWVRVMGEAARLA